MKALWDELASYHQPLLYNCGGLKVVADRKEKERVLFLMGLNESYATFRGSILMINPLPDTRKLQALLLQQEKQIDGWLIMIICWTGRGLGRLQVYG